SRPSGYRRWKTSATRLKTIAHDVESGIAHKLYVPAGRSEPFTSNGPDVVNRAALSALGVQTRPHDTSDPKSSRPRATGRRYTISTRVPAMVCETVSSWLFRF